MNQAVNIIHSAVFNFEYENKAVASKNNDLIESIFYSRILPELETAISNKIPNGISIELSKLEINIGTIEEKDMAENLAKQIRSSLEQALDLKLDITAENKDDKQNPQGGISWSILIFIEIFLTKGYFPYAIERSLSIDDLVVEAIQKYKDEFTGILRKHCTRDIVIRRTAFNLKPETIDKIILALNPVNAAWILEFRKMLVQLRNELNLNHSSREFNQLLNYSILKYLLNNMAPGFSKKNFATFILSEFADVFKSSTQQLFQLAQKFPGQSSMFAFVKETLTEMLTASVPAQDNVIPLAQLIKLLNSGKINTSIGQYNLLRKEITLTIQSDKKRKRLIEKLNETGAFLMLELINKEKAHDLFELIKSFAKELSSEPDKIAMINKLLVQSALYSYDSAIREFNKEEFILFLIHSAGLDESTTSGSSAFKKFIQSRKDIDQKKFSKAIKAEQKFHEISKINELLLKKGKTTQQSGSVNRGYLHIYHKKIVSHFLGSGYLPSAFSNLPLADVQQMFYGLLNQKDALLAEQLKVNDNAKDFFARLNLLKGNLPFATLHNYLTHFFPDEYALLTETINEISQIFIFRSEKIQSSTFKDNIFIQALVKSKGKSTTHFTFFVLEQLNIELTEDVTKSEELYRFIAARLGEALHIKFPLADKLEERNNLLFTLVHQINADFSKLKSKQLKELLDLVTSDKKAQEKFISEVLKTGNSPQLLFENKKILNYIEHLWAFSKTTESRVTEEFWHSTVLHFLLQIFPEERQLTVENFIYLFLTHLQKALAAINKEELISVIGNDLRASGSKELKEINEFWQTKKEKILPVWNETEATDFYISILEFYAENEFLPWWTRDSSVSELLEKEFILKQRMDRFPIAVWRKLKSKFDKQLPQEEIQTLQKNKETVDSEPGEDFNINIFLETAGNDDKILFLGLYKWTDEQILDEWLVNRPEIKEQIRDYLTISPYFYFRNVTPPIWRQAVYRFSLKYYQEKNKAKDDQFHAHFLNDLKNSHGFINWPEILTTVYQTTQMENKNFPVIAQILKPESTIQPSANDNEIQSLDTLEMDETGIETKIYNAGLILFWPFLTRLFEQLLLLNQGAFINSESRNRAVYILQYLVYNEINFPEHELVLNKLLTGMPPEVHLEPFITLTDNEKDMTKSLLNGLIGNWDKVQNSTPEGIQETFLQRSGILKFKTEEVSLTVEKMGVDILMHSIPWNFSVIKLGWMKKPLQVKWI